MPIKIMGEWSLSQNFLNITFAYVNKLLYKNNILKLKKNLNLITSKWTDTSNYDSLYPPYIECLKNEV